MHVQYAHSLWSSHHAVSSGGREPLDGGKAVLRESVGPVVHDRADVVRVSQDVPAGDVLLGPGWDKVGDLLRDDVVHKDLDVAVAIETGMLVGET